MVGVGVEVGVEVAVAGSGCSRGGVWLDENVAGVVCGMSNVDSTECLDGTEKGRLVS